MYFHYFVQNTYYYNWNVDVFKYDQYFAILWLICVECYIFMMLSWLLCYIRLLLSVPDHIVMKLSVRVNTKDFVSTNFTFFDCAKHIQ